VAQGQLEYELSQNAWLSVPASEQILFELPAEERLPAAMALLGVDYATLSQTQACITVFRERNSDSG